MLTNRDALFHTDAQKTHFPAATAAWWEHITSSVPWSVSAVDKLRQYHVPGQLPDLSPLRQPWKPRWNQPESLHRLFEGNYPGVS